MITGLSLLTVLTTSAAWGGKLVLSTQERLRYEVQSRFNQKFYGPHPPYGKTNDSFLLSRLRLGADWYPSPNLHLALWIQDSRAWDWAMPNRAFYNKSLDAQNNPQKDHLELYTTYVEIIRPMGLPLSIKAGRQRIAYGDHRVFGPGQWGNSGRYIWDAIKIHLEKRGAFLDMFYGRNVIHEINRFSLKHRHDKSTLALYGHLTLAPWRSLKTTIEPFFFTKWDRHDRFSGERGGKGKLQLAYAGLHWTGKWHSLDWNHTWVGMWGHKGPDSVAAYAYHLEGGISFNTPVKSRVYLAYSYASGDKRPKDGRINRFDVAFGSVDKAYGRMNLFKWSNLKDQEGGLEVWPLTGVHVKLEYHHFRLVQSKDGWSHNPSFYRDPTERSGKEMGHELDVVIQWKVSKSQEIQAGYGHFWPGEFVKKLASPQQASWFFIQYQITLKKVL